MNPTWRRVQPCKKQAGCVVWWLIEPDWPLSAPIHEHHEERADSSRLVGKIGLAEGVIDDRKQWIFGPLRCW